MVTSNHVLTGIVGYRSLELAMLELTLFQTVPREMETHSPLDGRPHHPAGPQGLRPGEDYWRSRRIQVSAGAGQTRNKSG